MTHLVTGGAGLIGSRIARDIIKEGEQVVVYDLFPEGSFLERLLNEEEKSRVKIVQGDVTDLPHLIRTVKENNAEVIFHMAALLTDASSANPPLAIKTNCEGTINVFETARLLGLKKIVWASSATVFGPPEKYPQEYIPNNAPHYPWGVYGACKSLNESVAAHYNEQYGTDITGIRYTLVYGAGQTRGKSGAIIRELILNPAVGKPGRVPFGDASRGWLYVDDAARAAVLTSKATRTKTQVFNSMGDLHSVREIADYVKQILPDADITLLPGNLGNSWKFETMLIEKETDFHPQWSMERGVKEVINITRRQHGLPPV